MVDWNPISLILGTFVGLSGWVAFLYQRRLQAVRVRMTVENLSYGRTAERTKALVTVRTVNIGRVDTGIRDAILDVPTVSSEFRLVKVEQDHPERNRWLKAGDDETYRFRLEARPAFDASGLTGTFTLALTTGERPSATIRFGEDYKQSIPSTAWQQTERLDRH